MAPKKDQQPTDPSVTDPPEIPPADGPLPPEQPDEDAPPPEPVETPAQDKPYVTGEDALRNLRARGIKI